MKLSDLKPGMLVKHKYDSEIFELVAGKDGKIILCCSACEFVMAWTPKRFVGKTPGHEDIHQSENWKLHQHSWEWVNPENLIQVEGSW